MILILTILLLLYLGSMTWILIGLMKHPYFHANKSKPNIKFSLIIPFRNEAENLPRLLTSLRKMKYPTSHFEILFVNDASEDASQEIILAELVDSDISYQIFQNERYSNSPKKDAISLAVKKAAYDWIATTDADCSVPQIWLLHLSEFIQKQKPKMVCGPVLFETDSTLLQQFQFWDGLSLQAATIAGFGWNTPVLSNAANLAFKKNAFFEVNGFEGNNHLASGDDVFLMEKIKKLFPHRIHYIKNSATAVVTQPVDSLKKLIMQRIRWASKTSKNKNIRTRLLGSIVFLGNIGFIIAFISCFIYPMEAQFFAFYLLLKLTADTLVLGMTTSFFKKSMLSPFLFPCNFSYPFVVVWVFINSWNGSYEWKGRNFRK
jgi:poly-beta-1,6-N-acetyl-D-glucosamine synthase